MLSLRTFFFVQIVDFCCGANDFSVILAQKLNELGKTNCEYINFDLITARVRSAFVLLHY